MDLIWQSVRFHPDLVVAQYVSRRGGEYMIFDVDKRSKTLRERYASRAEIPAHIADAADARYLHFPNQIRNEEIIP